MNEGDVFNTEALTDVDQRCNQLGYFKQMESAPDIKPSEEADNKVTSRSRSRSGTATSSPSAGRERARGHLPNASLLDHEFLGRRNFQIYAQTGKRTKNTRCRSASPTSSDRPITAGSSLSGGKITYLSYYTSAATRRRARGPASSPASIRGQWSRAFLNYTYESSSSAEANASNLYYNSIYGGTSSAASSTVRSTTAPLRRLRTAEWRAGSPRTSSTTPSTTFTPGAGCGTGDHAVHRRPLGGR